MKTLHSLQKGNKDDIFSENASLYNISEDDDAYERELVRNPFSLKSWLRYIQHKANQSIHEQVFIFERACSDLPGSYKLWRMYLNFRKRHLEGLNPAKYQQEYEKVNFCYERALASLNKMPRIWMDYLEFLVKQCKITETRRTFDRALQTLPVTQHERIWKLYKEFSRSVSGETAVKIFPEMIEEYIQLLIDIGYYNEAAFQYIDMLNNPGFKSIEGKSYFHHWVEFSELIAKYADKIKGISVEKIMRSAMNRFTDQQGRFWTNLAIYFTTIGDFEKARDAFEEGMVSVITVRDFTQIFDTYAEFEESIISKTLEEISQENVSKSTDPDRYLDLDIKMIRFEQLMDRRPFLVNDVLLRQNPYNVVEWEKRVKLWGNVNEKIVETYTDAIKTVDPKKAVGKLSSLFINFAKFYEKNDDLDTARIIMGKSVMVPFKSVHELADVWCEWAELELRNNNFDEAVKIMKKAINCPEKSDIDYFDERLTPQQRIHKSARLWMFYVDLEESVGTIASTRAAYDKILSLKIATPQTIVNYANFLEENKYFEESFKVYERGVELFSYPVVFEIWNLYLSKFVKRFGGTKNERTRDLFEQSLKGCPSTMCKSIFLMYGDFEEKYGLTKHAMSLYHQATEMVSEEDRADMYKYYIAKMRMNYAVLPDKDAKDMCLKFAEMERSIGEIDRARAIYAHASQFCNPKTITSFWEIWHEFEVKHGNEDTYAEMLRIKRSVQSHYNANINYITTQTSTQHVPETSSSDDVMTTLEKSKVLSGFVREVLLEVNIRNPLYWCWTFKSGQRNTYFNMSDEYAASLPLDNSDYISNFDSKILINFISHLVEVILNANEYDINEYIINSDDCLQKCEKFVSDTTLIVFYIVKNVKENLIDTLGDNYISYNYCVDLELCYSTQTVAVLALVKRTEQLNSTITLQDQLQVFSMPGWFQNDSSSASMTSYKFLYTLIHSVVSPYFDAFAKENDKEFNTAKPLDPEYKSGIPSTKKKIAELELSLLNLQQNVEIPKISLTVHPEIEKFIIECQKQDIHPSIQFFPSNLLTDSTFLNSLQSNVNFWIKSIQTVTGISHDPASGSASQEINFWLNMEASLESIEKQLKSDGVVLTMEILKQAKRFHTIISFVADTGLKEINEKVYKYNQLMREFPLNELLAATSLDKVQKAILQIFNHLNKKLRICPYPIRRVLPLIEAISSDLNTRIQNLLSNQKLMHLEYIHFKKVIKLTDEIFQTWDDQLKEFTNMAREITRKRSEKFIPIKITSQHIKIQERLAYIKVFRQGHEQLQSTVISVLGMSKFSSNKNYTKFDEINDVNIVNEISEAYSPLKAIDVLDISPDGTRLWLISENNYNDQISRIENIIINKLRDKLSSTKTASEMFLVFSKFNLLFIRPKIRGAIQEYQTQLINNVKLDIANLHDRFKKQYNNSESYSMAQLRDIPPVSGAIIWARQIERQLDLYMKNVEYVLGKGWELYVEAQKLQTDSSIFKNKLNTRQIYETWLQDVTQRNFSITGKLFKIVRNRTLGNLLELNVNFDHQIIILFKEIRNLQWLNFSIPHSLNSISKEVKRLYPYVMSLIGTVRNYTQINEKISHMDDVSILLVGYQNDVLNFISKGMSLEWESFIHSYDGYMRTLDYVNINIKKYSDMPRENRYVLFVHDFSVSVSTLSEKTNILFNSYDIIFKELEKLHTCVYDHKSFNSVLENIQKEIDRLNFENFSNLDFWVNNLNSKIENILIERIIRATQIWVKTFISFKETNNSNPEEEQTGCINSYSAGYNNHTLPEFKQFVYKIYIRNQSISLQPSIETSKLYWFKHFHNWIDIVCKQKKIFAFRYQMKLNLNESTSQNIETPTYTYLLSKVCSPYLFDAYSSILKIHNEINIYIEKWFQFQSLWDLQLHHVCDFLGNDLTKWLQILREVRKSRSIFDTAETLHSFGFLLVDYTQVQNRINVKYDSWQKDILNKFSNQLSENMREFYTQITKIRHSLESQTLEGSMEETISFIAIVQECKEQMKKHKELISLYHQGQTILSKQRYQFSNDWLYIDQIEGEWGMLSDILSRKSALIADQIDALKMKVIAEDRITSSKISIVINDWNEKKPISGDYDPSLVFDMLSEFESKINHLVNEKKIVLKAKEILNLDSNIEDSLSIVLEEVVDFKSVWSLINTLWKTLNELMETPWSNVIPRKIRQSLDSLMNVTKEMPSSTRQYLAFEHMQNLLRQYIKSNYLISELKSDAIKERHWEKLFKLLRPQEHIALTSLTIGDIWKLDLITNKDIIMSIISDARGEMILEEFIRNVRETWSNYSLNLLNYRNICKLICGWDDLFTKSVDDLNSLSAMKNSPHYKIFQEEASSWEYRLNKIHILFDIWADVQQQWVYLEGIFSGNTDIKHLLPIESQRFQNISSEFLTIMKKVYESPFVLNVLAISNIHKSIERLLDLLQKTRKALSEYLEKERTLFPRFYFIGDEDLLEIIGNSNDIKRIQKHFPKMFSGLHNLILNEDSTIITGFSSKEGETVFLKKPINLSKIPKINEWLDLLDDQVKNTLSDLLILAVNDFRNLYENINLNDSCLLSFFDKYPAQVIVLSSQILWTENIETALLNSNSNEENLLKYNIFRIGVFLNILSAIVINDIDVVQRKKSENLITCLVYQRSIVDMLLNENVSSTKDFKWQYQMRFILKDKSNAKSLRVIIGNVSFNYGFEYLGMPDRLIQTSLNDKCFLALTQALKQKLGGSLFGPAGTGKTESVKALGIHLGKFVQVFCCDSAFDFQAMGRILLGICRVGAWGCFDEFNRLEENILSAISQHVQIIQLGLKNIEKNKHTQIELIEKKIEVHPETGIFVTMNPGYSGRSNLPDNLKKLFRSISMVRPDKQMIAQITLYSHGFSMAKELASTIVPFFERCSTELSSQFHYDFGLRALKDVLIISGNLKRFMIRKKKENSAIKDVSETEIIVQSLRETVFPKLIKNDLQNLINIEKELFPNVNYIPANFITLEEEIKKISASQNLFLDNDWMTKILQLYKIQTIHYGIIMVGSPGTGKSKIWHILLESLENFTGIKSVYHIIDPKVFSKEILYGTLDSVIREWTDGLFTSIIRKIVNNLRQEQSKRHWIIFDGKFINKFYISLLIFYSVLDDNKLLTLPNGERLNISDNIRIIFETDTLKYATLATISRCGMVWFDQETVKPDMILHNYLNSLRSKVLEQVEDYSIFSIDSTNLFVIQKIFADILDVSFLKNGLVIQAIEYAQKLNHIMSFMSIRSLNSLFTLINATCKELARYNSQHEDFPLTNENIETYISKKLLLHIIWSFSGDCKFIERQKFEKFIVQFTTVELPNLSNNKCLLDYDVSLPYGDWELWKTKVPVIEIDVHSLFKFDFVVPTVDTLRHEALIYSCLAEHKFFILSGPPGSGKTMILLNALRKLPNIEVVILNFSSTTGPDLIIKTLEQNCEYVKTIHEVIMKPRLIGRWLAIFCDEINLPALDAYGTQRVINFLRQLIEHGKFWSSKIKAWVRLERIQFVGACNPPEDIGRVVFSNRFLRHSLVIMVDYPEKTSLIQIYQTFNKMVLKCMPNLRNYYKEFTYAMIDFYLLLQEKFTPNIHAHYIYSPRELTRWVRNIYEIIFPLEILNLDELARLWFHESLRLFQDRLVDNDEKQWVEETFKRILLEYFPNLSESIFNGPLLFSNWLSKNYTLVNKESLQDYIQARLKTFCEEEIDAPLILFDSVLDHVLRIDRVFRQSQGHLIFIGISGSGKTVLSRFVAWMNGLKTFQIKIHSKYSSDDFDNDLRHILLRAGCKGEKICFILDESNISSTSFLERINTLLANSEITGLFEGESFTSLISNCKEATQKEGLLLDSQDELYNWFSQQISKNLHVVFTMNPLNDGLLSKASASPALFNRCIIDWFGDWPIQGFYQVASELTCALDLEKLSYIPPLNSPTIYVQGSFTYREAILDSIVFIHYSIQKFNEIFLKSDIKIYLTPKHFIDFVQYFVQLYSEKREKLEDQQRHLNSGIQKLQNTVNKVFELKQELAKKQQQLELKNEEANHKLKRIVEEQKEAEQRRIASLEIQESLYLQEEKINSRKKMVIEDLAKVEHTVAEARRSVSDIKKQHLTELRSMTNPPEVIKLTMESVCTLLGQKFDTWKTVQGIIKRDDFISNILNYDNDKQMTKALRIKLQTSYISNPNFTFDIVNHASKACGPLVLWVCAQVNYSMILEKIAPLREEVNDLEKQVSENKIKMQNIITMIQELGENIILYKDEYATLISDMQVIKSEMNNVQQKVDRSLQLLDSLSSERNRWELESQSFENQLDTLAGDVLLSSAFLAYLGIYDQQARLHIQNSWKAQLHSLKINIKENNPVSEYLVTIDEKSDWIDNLLPSDDFYIENALVLKRCYRYPLIIDPSDCVTKYLIKNFKEKKLIVTSFLDNTFVKHLESALRFGNSILIQDAEYLDPILNPILNKEYQRTDGRILVRLGKQDIDFSPTFRLFLLTKNSSANFGPEISSRVTFVNFTITSSNLESQSLNKILHSERPEVNERRDTLVRLQNKFKLRLTHLEKNLLDILNESHENILDDDSVLKALESLKKEASEISEKAAETEEIINEIEQVTLSYKSVSSLCSSIFEIMERLSLICPVLNNNEDLKKENDFSKRIQILLRDIMLTTFKKVSRALLHKHHVFFGLLITRLAISVKGIKGFHDNIFELIFSNETPENDFSKDPSIINIKKLKIPYFTDIDKYINGNLEMFNFFLTTEKAEDHVPILWEYCEEKLNNNIRQLLIIKMFRMDRLVLAIEKFINDIFGENIFSQISYDIKSLIENETTSQTPIVLCSVSGYDVSYKIENLVNQISVDCKSVAMGSIEGLSQADREINLASQKGTWILLKNVHLTTSWLDLLEKKLQSLKHHPNFRLFITMEISLKKVPVNLLRMSRMVMFEPLPGIKANMLDTFGSIPISYFSTGPIEKNRLYFLLSWFHALLQERLRYVPLGWSKSYEFNESDFESGIWMIDNLIENISQGRSNISPEKIPWEAIRLLLCDSIYGAKIDSDNDLELLHKMTQNIFVYQSFDLDYELVEKNLTIPDCLRREEFLNWIQNLPQRESPTWLGLPENSEKIIFLSQGKEMLDNIRIIINSLKKN
ncbi:hypothetical protein PCANB_000003 [Pneumocystis canis]|nr:hypothetical protein PCANB_000003 [Pneumocystis canis]